MKFVVDASLPCRREVLELPSRSRAACVGLWSLCGSWSGHSYEPGFVPIDIAKRWDPRMRRAAALERHGLWLRDEVKGEDGYQLITPAQLCWFTPQDDDDGRVLRKYGQFLEERRHPRRPSRDRIPTELRRTVYDRDGWRCVQCLAGHDLTLDHIWPWSKGGQDTEENLRTLCRSCNSRKGARV